jgi:hypothetical protein
MELHEQQEDRMSDVRHAVVAEDWTWLNAAQRQRT